jgi:DNA helicase-2/ATP-dependent DNA helicase PcrA
MMELDQTRRDILAASGHLLIEGGPGSGKTTIALLKAAQSVATLEAEQRVLFLSFSRAAVRQISERVSEHLTFDTRDHLEVRTFHAFFLSLVRAHGPLLTGTPSEFLPPDAENRVKADHAGDWDTETQELARRGVYVFDQLATTAATLLERSSALRHLYSDRYPLVIVDEFQDTNIDQWRAVKALSLQSTLICLADPDQRIYDAFVKGIDEARIQHAVDALDPKRFNLAGDNHRNAGNGILNYANAVLRDEPAPLPTAIQYIPYSYPQIPEQVTHYVIRALQDHYTERLGRQPTIAVLALENAFIAQISEAISNDQALPTGQTLPALDHELVWDPGLSAAAGFVVASVLEWPTLPRVEAVTATLRNIADFYRVKVANGTTTARSAIGTIERAIAAFTDRRAVRANTGRAVIDAYDHGIRFTGNPITDWQLARARLRDGSREMQEVFNKARLLRLFHASDTLAWGLSQIWDGEASYPGAAGAVRRILANELLVGRPTEPHPVTLMNLHKSKGKEFDAVVIVEGQYRAKLMDPTWDATRITQTRRVLRVAITRARHHVIIVRPTNAVPLLAP